MTAAGSEVLKRRQSLTGSPAGPAAGIDSDAGPWYRDTGATLAPARTGSRVPAAPRLESASQPQTFPRSFSAPNKFAQAGPRQIVATSSQTVRFSRCTSGPAGSRDLAPAAPRLASQPQTLSQEPPRLGSAAPRRVSVPTGSRDLAHAAAAGFSRCPSGSSHSVVSQQQHQLSQSAEPRRPRSST